MLQIKGVISLDLINCTTGDGLGDLETKLTGLYDTIQQCVDAVKGGLISGNFSLWFKSPKLLFVMLIVLWAKLHSHISYVVLA